MARGDLLLREGAEHGYVVTYGGVEDKDLLLYYGYEVVEGLAFELPELAPAEADLAGIVSVRGHEQAQEGGFPAAGGADEGGALAGAETERDVVQHLAARAVAEGDPPELYALPGQGGEPALVPLPAGQRGGELGP